MNRLAAVYRRKLNLPHARFAHIDHEDAMVATVFKVTQSDGTQLIFEIFERFNHKFQAMIASKRISLDLF